MIFTPKTAPSSCKACSASGRNFLPYVLSFGVLGLCWLSNIEARSRAEYVNREYVNWWLFYLLLITCVPFCGPRCRVEPVLRVYRLS